MMFKDATTEYLQECINTRCVMASKPTIPAPQLTGLHKAPIHVETIIPRFFQSATSPPRCLQLNAIFPDCKRRGSLKKGTFSPVLES